MLRRFFSFRRQKSATVNLPASQDELILGALLVHAAKVDEAYLFQEVEQIEAVLAKRHGLTPKVAMQMRIACEEVQEEWPSTLELVGKLHNDIPLSQRRAVVSAMWSVVFADGVEHKDENALLRMIEDLLGVDPNDSLALRAEEFEKSNLSRRTR